MKPTDPFQLLGFGEGGWGLVLLAGAAVTLQIALAAYALGLLIGLLLAWAKLRGPWWARGAAEGYTTVVQGLPDILVILLIYYGGTSAVRDLVQMVSPGATVEINAFAAGVVALGVVSGAYQTDVFRAAFQGIPRGQAEAARSLGMRQAPIFATVLAPQALRLALPPLGNVWLVTLKDSALVSVVGIRDLLGVAGSGASFSRQPFTFYMAVAVVYLVLSIVSGWLISRLEARVARSDGRR
ncbi:ABC transporter permease [Chthonobacter rhizosphaerae]|uniref:ABC transporter permease n=1 Tax=Chthonobacter rhizosphaerae TaxID=2735553 RepID=UPI0015EE93DC|nr:ABC transporter permease subunit [Chthonobacter rhizosphaerae]